MEQRVAAIEGGLTELVVEIRTLVIEMRHSRGAVDDMKTRVDTLEKEQVELRIEAQNWRNMDTNMKTVKMFIVGAMVAQFAGMMIFFWSSMPL